MKKYYIAPISKEMAYEEEEMIASSQLDPSQDSQTITATEEEYGGAFGSRSADTWD